MERSIDKIILPALKSTNPLALEQASILRQHLRLLARQISKLTQYENACLDDLLSLSEVILSRQDRDKNLAGAFENFRDTCNDSVGAEPRERYNLIGFALDRLMCSVQDAGDSAVVDDFIENLLRYSLRQSIRERAWFVDAGFDPRPGELPQLETLIQAVKDDPSANVRPAAHSTQRVENL
jgi:hypothetical protein